MWKGFSQLWKNKLWVIQRAKPPSAFWDSSWTYSCFGSYKFSCARNLPQPLHGRVSKEKGNYKKTTHTHTNLQAIQSTLRHNPCQGYLISLSEVLTSWGCGRRCRAAWRTQNNVWLERKSFSKQLEGVDWLVTDFWQSCNNIPALLSSHQHYKHTAYLNEWKLLCVWESASVSLLHMRFRNVYLPSEVKISFLHPSSLCFLLQISDIV